MCFLGVTTALKPVTAVQPCHSVKACATETLLPFVDQMLPA